MCGRFVVARASGELAAEFDVDRVADDPAGTSYNFAPTTRIPLIVDTRAEDADTGAEDGAEGGAGVAGPGAGSVADPAADSAGAAAERPRTPGSRRIRRLEAARWGLIPSWAKDPSVGVRAFNARSETAAVKPTFRAAVTARRGMVPADGYYEWRKRNDGDRQPFYIHPADGSSLPLAALYEWWREPDGGWLLSASILTRAATGDLAAIHDRMPVFLDRSDLDLWLDPTRHGDAELVEEIAIRGAEIAPRLTLTPVGSAVGNVRNDGPDLIRPVDLDQ